MPWQETVFGGGVLPCLIEEAPFPPSRDGVWIGFGLLGFLADQLARLQSVESSGYLPGTQRGLQRIRLGPREERCVSGAFGGRAGAERLCLFHHPLQSCHQGL